MGRLDKHSTISESSVGTILREGSRGPIPLPLSNAPWRVFPRPSIKSHLGFWRSFSGYPPSAYRGLGDEDIPVPDIVGSIQEMEFDEMRHFFQ
jgi:hypothetical protein